MKDPWQHEPSAYELLGVSELATDSEVDRAFKLAMGRVTPQQAIQARNALRRPEERALLNLFRYDQRSLELASFPLASEYLSDVASRRKVAQALIVAEKSEPMLAHTVAVLHYWWAKRVPIGTDGIPPCRTPWGIAISHFIVLLNHPDLKYEWFDPEVDPDLVRDAAIERLRSELQAEHIRYRESGDLPSCLAIDDMQRRFEVELIAAAKMDDIPEWIVANDRYDKLLCGPMFLDLHEWRSVLDPDYEQTKVWFSPFAPALIPLQLRQPDVALQVLDQLCRQNGTNESSWAVRAHIFLELGQAKAVAGDYGGALTSWSECKRGTQDDLDSQLSKCINAAITPRVMAMMNNEPAKAEQLTNHALRVCATPELRSLHAELLRRRAESALDQVAADLKHNGELPDSVMAEHIRTIEASIRVLDEAVKSDSTLQERRNQARRFLAHVFCQRGEMILERATNDLRREGGLSEPEKSAREPDVKRAVAFIKCAAMSDESLKERRQSAEAFLGNWPQIFSEDYCWFCDWRHADPSNAHVLPMCRIKRVNMVGEAVQYQTIEVKTPRCKRCADIHAKLKSWKPIAVACALVSGTIGAIITSEIDLFDFAAAFAFVLFAVSAVLVVRKVSRPKEVTRDTSYALASPLYKYALSEGFVVGAYPGDGVKYYGMSASR